MTARNLNRGQLLQRESDRRASMRNGLAIGDRSVDDNVANACGQCRLAIGQCSCSGGGASRVMLATSNPRGIPQGGGGTLVADLGPTTPPPDAGGWTVIPPVGRGCYPLKLCNDHGVPTGWSRAMGEVMAMGKQEPYIDTAYDWANMDVLYSDLITATPGVAVNVDVSPEQGTFAMFYYSLVAVDPTTQVSQVDWRITRPSVPGCPSPCNTPGPILSQFVSNNPESCCGIPLTAFLDKRNENVPLRTPFTNNQAAGDLLVQMQVRGYCCSTRIC